MSKFNIFGMQLDYNGKIHVVEFNESDEETKKILITIYLYNTGVAEGGHDGNKYANDICISLAGYTVYGNYFLPKCLYANGADAVVAFIAQYIHVYRIFTYYHSHSSGLGEPWACSNIHRRCTRMSPAKTMLVNCTVHFWLMFIE